MIVIEGAWWPLVFVGHAADATTARRQAVLVDERCLELSDDLRVALVVAGSGAAALRAHRDLLTWLQRCEPRLEPRTQRLAWVIEDEDCRAWTNAWLRLLPVPLFNAPAATFGKVAEAIDWLLPPANRMTGRANDRDAVASVRRHRASASVTRCASARWW